MTTQAAAAQYLAEHQAKWGDKKFAVHNPKGLPITELPVIYGFNNGGSQGWLNGVLIAEDGSVLGGHISSDESYMLHDLGILEDARPDRHDVFKEHYPAGYRMDFVSHYDAADHVGLQAAFDRHEGKGA
ncbi:MAG: hypothetical protein JJ939_11555 [Alphaproteobacteria bacterium]|nr:hypothetical protein [Alphaproteobacteria bacterium]MBO6629051.1 hypothetical protein [Alphaproteobacteria bacterium]